MERGQGAVGAYSRGICQRLGIAEVLLKDPEVILRISHRVGIMLEGKLVAVGQIQELTKQKFGIDQERYTLEEICLRYFREDARAAA